MMKSFRSVLVKQAVGRVLFVLCALFLAGCATDHSTIPVRTAEGNRGGSDRPWENPDALRFGELLVIEFSGVSDPPPRHEERIKTDGHVTLPSIGQVKAAGLTRGELEKAIHDQYVPNYYRQLTVIVRNEGRFFYVKGQVNNPGQFPYLKEMTVLKAVAVAGDFTDFAKKTQVLVTRADGQKLKVNCVKAVGDSRLDLPIFPDDTIEVPRRYF